MQEVFNPAVQSAAPTDTKNAKYCVALNYKLNTVHMQSKDGGQAFDSLVSDDVDEPSPDVLGILTSNPDYIPVRLDIEPSGLSHETFAASLADQLQGALFRDSVWDINPAFDGAVVFSLHEREVKTIKERFPSHQGTLEVFDSKEELTEFMDNIAGRCIQLNIDNDNMQMHLDA